MTTSFPFALDFSSGHRCACVNPSGVPEEKKEHCLSGISFGESARGQLFKVRSIAVLWRIWELYNSGLLDVRLSDGTQIDLPIKNGPVNPPDHPTFPLTADFSNLYGLPGNTYMERVPALQLQQGDLILGYAPTLPLEKDLNVGVLAQCYGFLVPGPQPVQGSVRALSVPPPVTFRRGTIQG